MMIGAITFAYKKGNFAESPEERRMSSAEGCPAMASWEDSIGGALVFCLLMFYIFCGLAVICDDYFCESLEKISEDLNLSEDVAGATFMAAGSSAPELFVSFADNVLAEEPKSLGVGTIIGSAIFNILIIIALTAALAGQELDLDYRPMARDSSWYAFSILLLVWSIFPDGDKTYGEVNTFESVVLVVAYVLYVLYMSQNAKIQAKFCGSSSDSGAAVPTDEKDAIDAAAAAVSVTDIEMRTVGEKSPEEDKDKEEEVKTGSWLSNYMQPLKWSSVAEEGASSKFWWIFSFPIQVAFRFTVPDCNDKFFERRRGFTTCFIMSIVWIGILSHFLVEFATKFGCIVGMPFPLMGLTIVAAGTSVPDAISSVVVAKSGQGDMAVSNAIGSNVFDILLGLGLPYFLSNVLKGKPVRVETEDLISSVIVLFGVLIAVIAILVYSKWKLNPKVGMSLFGLYFAYVIFAYATQL